MKIYFLLFVLLLSSCGKKQNDEENPPKGIHMLSDMAYVHGTVDDKPWSFSSGKAKLYKVQGQERFNISLSSSLTASEGAELNFYVPASEGTFDLSAAGSGGFANRNDISFQGQLIIGLIGDESVIGSLSITGQKNDQAAGKFVIQKTE